MVREESPLWFRMWKVGIFPLRGLLQQRLERFWYFAKFSDEADE